MRITHLVGLLLTCSLLLPVTAWSHPRAQGDDGDMPMEGEGPPPDAMEEMDPTAGPPMADILKDCTRSEGLFTFFQNKKTGQTFLALKPEQMNKEMLLSFTLNAGSGGGMFIAPMLWPDIPVYFKQTYRTVQMIVPNTYITADPKSPIARAVKTGTSDSILLTLPLFCQPAPPVEADDDEGDEEAHESLEEHRDSDAHDHADSDDDESSDADGDADEGDGDDSDEGDAEEDEEDYAPLPEGTILLDASQIFFSDLLNMGGQVSYLGGGTGIDPMGSFVTSIDNFPANTNVELTLNMFGSGFGQLGGSGFVPDPRSTITKMVICMSELPKNGFTPRLSDERIGYFLVMQQDFTDDKLDTRYKRYISRWKLEKKDPAAEISDPVEPIVFWIENTVPHEYREGVRQGIEAWQAAFTEAGFSNAIIAKQMPDDADWDPADIRYNTVRWFVAPGAGFAIGPSRANPYTGQIYDADIGFSADMMGFAQAEYTDLIDPLAIIARQRDRARANGMWLPPTLKELPEAHKHPELYGRNLLPTNAPQVRRPGSAAQRACNITQEALHEAASAFMASEIMLGDRMDRDEFVRQFLVAIVAHEVGHTLGLRHNYQASDYHSTSELNTAQAVESGLTGSMMDYTGTNLVPAGQPQGEWFQTRVGPYDKAAIKYGYMHIPGTGGQPENELNRLDDIASEWAEPGHGYLTDEDAFGWSAAMDPSATAWDLASDNITYFENQMTIADQLLEKIPQHYDGDGARYQKIRTGFGWALRSYAIGAMGVPKYIGGVYHSRNRVGDLGGAKPYTPVPAAQQREALNFIIRHYLKPDSFYFSPELLRSLAMEVEPDFEGTVYMTMRRDFPVHDIVLNLQSMPLMWIYDPIVLQRLQDSSKLLPAGTDQMTIAELFGGVRGAIWEEAFAKASVGSYRRNLQRMHLQAMTSIYLYGTGFYPQDAVTLARLDLTTLRDALKAAVASTTLDGLTRAHYQECIDQINATLNATTVRLG